MSEICPGEVVFSDGRKDIFDTVQILAGGALRTATLTQWHDQLDGWCESEHDIVFHPPGSWTSVTATAATGTLVVEDSAYVGRGVVQPEQRQPNIKRLAARVTRAEAITIAGHYLVDDHGFYEIDADERVRENLTYPSNAPITVRPSEEDRRKNGSRDRVIEFRYLTPPPSPSQTDQDKASVDAAFPPR